MRAHWRRSNAERPFAVSASVQSAARTPGTLFAAMETPVPVVQHTTPRSAVPSITAWPTAAPATGHGIPSATTTTSCPRASRKDAQCVDQRWSVRRPR